MPVSSFACLSDRHRQIRTGKAPSSDAAKIAIFLIMVYRNLLSCFILQSCRFVPSCSHYAEEALSRHGFLRGVVLTAKRIIRCQPFCQGGFDPVP